LTRITGILHEDASTFMIIAPRILLRMRNFSDRNCTENQNTFYAQYLFSENFAVYKVMQKYNAESEMQQKTI
jgi:hypothetical protein